MYRCKTNLYFISGFAVPLEIARDMDSQPPREMKIKRKKRVGIYLAREAKINLKPPFGMFVKKEKYHPRWDSNPQPLN